jgi:hypothetical protein
MIDVGCYLRIFATLILVLVGSKSYGANKMINHDVTYYKDAL